jgi:hypothetical protein
MLYPGRGRHPLPPALSKLLIINLIDLEVCAAVALGNPLKKRKCSPNLLT